MASMAALLAASAAAAGSRVHPQVEAGLAAFDPQTAWQSEKVGIPLHPGAERAYREKGWLK
jgi:TRAP-type uncharacterized transport system substrate-binding protein